jgi:DNA-binding PucR family transcriptional regulator
LGPTPSADALQQIVDTVADYVGRTTSIDDERFRLVVYSAVPGCLDRMTARSIIYREAPEHLVEALDAYSVAAIEGYARVCLSPELQMSPTLCVPIRHRNDLFGYLWIIDDPPVSPDKVEFAVDLAEQAGVIMRATLLERQSVRANVLTRLDGLLTAGDERERRDAAQELIDRGALPVTNQYAVAVLGLRDTSEDVMPERRWPRLSSLLLELGSPTSSRRRFVLQYEDHLATVIGGRDPSAIAQKADELFADARKTLAQDAHWSLHLGLGSPRPLLADCHISYREARLAALFAGRANLTSAPVSWESLGAFQIIFELLQGFDAESAIPDCVRQLSGDPDAIQLIECAEAYLDHGCDARDTASALFVHRSTIYKRLERISDITGLDLRRGDDRLQLHLGLKLLHLSQRDASAMSTGAASRQASRPARAEDPSLLTQRVDLSPVPPITGQLIGEVAKHASGTNGST